MSAPLCLTTFCGLDRVAERLRHLDAFEVDQEAVRQHLAERRAAARAEADEQRALEPAAVLIAAFEVDVSRPRQFRTHRQHRLVTRAGVEPDIEDVHLALERAVTAFRAGQARRHEFLGRPFVPGVRAVALEDRGGAFDDLRTRHRFAAGGAVERRNRHSPRALARDAPVRPVDEHVVDAIVSP